MERQRKKANQPLHRRIASAIKNGWWAIRERALKWWNAPAKHEIRLDIHISRNEPRQNRFHFGIYRLEPRPDEPIPPTPQQGIRDLLPNTTSIWFSEHDLQREREMLNENEPDAGLQRLRQEIKQRFQTSRRILKAIERTRDAPQDADLALGISRAMAASRIEFPQPSRSQLRSFVLRHQKAIEHELQLHPQGAELRAYPSRPVDLHVIIAQVR